jgi:DNA repair exonuclease SbcCD ATPase subunit
MNDALTLILAGLGLIGIVASAFAFFFTRDRRQIEDRADAKVRKLLESEVAALGGKADRLEKQNLQQAQSIAESEARIRVLSDEVKQIAPVTELARNLGSLRLELVGQEESRREEREQDKKQHEEMIKVLREIADQIHPRSTLREPRA